MNRKRCGAIRANNRRTLQTLARMAYKRNRKLIGPRSSGAEVWALPFVRHRRCTTVGDGATKDRPAADKNRILRKTLSGHPRNRSYAFRQSEVLYILPCCENRSFVRRSHTTYL